MAVPNKEMLPYREMDEASRTEIAVLFAKKEFSLFEIFLFNREDKAGRSGGWHMHGNVSRILDEHGIYRTKPVEIKVPWDFIDKKWVALAMNKDGRWYAYQNKKLCINKCKWDSIKSLDVTSQRFFGDILNLPSETEIDWQDSLTLRPESE